MALLTFRLLVTALVALPLLVDGLITSFGGRQSRLVVTTSSIRTKRNFFFIYNCGLIFQEIIFTDFFLLFIVYFLKVLVFLEAFIFFERFLHFCSL